MIISRIFQLKSSSLNHPLSELTKFSLKVTNLFVLLNENNNMKKKLLKLLYLN